VPFNFKGKYYDLRPYVDELDWLVIRRGPNVGKFKFKGKRLLCRTSGYYHIDKYDLVMMKKQARKLIPVLVKKEKSHAL